MMRILTIILFSLSVIGCFQPLDEQFEQFGREIERKVEK